MNTVDRQVTEIRDALDREAARRFDAERVLAELVRRSSSVTVHAAPARGGGPLARLPVSAQWATLAAALLGVALGMRGLWLSPARVAAPAAAIQAPDRPAGEARVDAPRAEDPPAPRPTAARARPARPPATEQRRPRASAPVEIAHADPPPAAASDPVEVVVVPPAKATPGPGRRTALPVPVPGPTPLPTVVAPGAAPPSAFRTGGVQVESFVVAGVPRAPAVIEVPEVGATLVLATTRRLSRHSNGAEPAAAHAGTPRDNLPRLLLASFPPAPDGGAPGADAYYARVFLGSRERTDAGAQGLLGQPPAVQVVPLREAELWGDAEQERYLSRTFGLRSVIAVDGARLPAADDAARAQPGFIAAAGGELLDVSLTAHPLSGAGPHSMAIRIWRRAGGEPRRGSVSDVDARLVVDNGRIVILGLPPPPAGADPVTLAFVALSPRFDEFAPSPDAEAVRTLDDDVDPPVIVESPAPEYPPQARPFRAEGKVTLQATIRKDGEVDRVQVLRVPEVPGAWYLVEAAARTVRRWRYLPARVDGHPVHVLATVDVEFEAR